MLYGGGALPNPFDHEVVVGLFQLVSIITDIRMRKVNFRFRKMGFLSRGWRSSIGSTEIKILKRYKISISTQSESQTEKPRSTQTQKS